MDEEIPLEGLARVELASGREVLVSLSASTAGVSAESDISVADALRFDDFTMALGELGQGIVKAVSAVAPDRVTIEFGASVAYASGKLTALIADGSAKGDIKVKLEWDRGEDR